LHAHFEQHSIESHLQAADDAAADLLAEVRRNGRGGTPKTGISARLAVHHSEEGTTRASTG